MGCGSGSTLPIDQVAIDAADPPPRGAVVRPGRCGAPPSPWRAPHRLDVAYARLEQTEVAEAMAEWWLDRLARLVRAGIAGFRCLDPDHAPASLWRRIIGAFEAASDAASWRGRRASNAPRCRDWRGSASTTCVPRSHGGMGARTGSWRRSRCCGASRR